MVMQQNVVSDFLRRDSICRPFIRQLGIANVTVYSAPELWPLLSTLLLLFVMFACALVFTAERPRS